MELAVNSFTEIDYDMGGLAPNLTISELQDSHKELIQLIIWKKIKELAIMACDERMAVHRSSAESSSTSTVPPTAKRMKHASLFGMLSQYDVHGG